MGAVRGPYQPVNNTFVFPVVRQDFIIPALRSLRQFTPSHHKIIVINQTRPNAGFENQLRHFADLVISTKLNYGFAQATNMGVRLTTTEFVTICNDDLVFFSEDWWPGVLRTFERFPVALAVNPMSPKEPGWGYGESGYRLWLGKHILKKLPSNHPYHERALALYATKPDYYVEKLQKKWGASVVDGFAGWCVTFKRKEWVELGMFDERFFPGGGEDYDACARAYQAGYRMLSSPESWIWHHWGQSKDEATGFDVAQPHARSHWNKLSTKGFGPDGLWEPDCDVWGKTGVRTNLEVRREAL